MNLKSNMGGLDKAIRILVATVIGFLFITHVIEGTLAIILMVLALVFLLTSIVGICPLYLPFGIKTKSDKKE